MKNLILLIFISFICMSAKAQGEPQWFKDRIANDVAKVYHTKSFIPHKDAWKGQPYKLIPLKELWADSDKEGTVYLNSSERQKYKLTFEKGRIWDAKGNEFDTRGINGAIFVMTKDGSIYASRKEIANRFEHHSFVSGESVVCAGKLVIYNGHLKIIDDVSAQYPTKNHYPLTRVVSNLKSKGISFRKVKVVYYKDFN
ncbi:hypothetical protein N9948_00520 [bacterium]|nr:hypothetical protein [bacterium]